MRRQQCNVPYYPPFRIADAVHRNNEAIAELSGLKTDEDFCAYLTTPERTQATIARLTKENAQYTKWQAQGFELARLGKPYGTPKVTA